jgi:aconitate hydratase
MGVLPLQFLPGQNAENLGLTGKETFNIDINNSNLKVGQQIEVTTNNGKKFNAKLRIDTEPELAYYKNGGILHYVLRKLMKQ